MLRHRVAFLDGPLEGLVHIEATPPAPSLHFAIQTRPSATAAEDLEYAVSPLAHRGADGTSHYIGLFNGTFRRSREMTEEAGILCAYCGRDPATGEEVDD